MLDLTPFANAVARLEEGLERYESDVADLQIRDGLIQRFEFTYELAHKTIKRFLESVAPSTGDFETADFPFLIRTAGEHGLLLHDWAAWKGYRAMRAKTSQSYDEEIAQEVVAGIPSFLAEARHVLDRLQQRLAG